MTTSSQLLVRLILAGVRDRQSAEALSIDERDRILGVAAWGGTEDAAWTDVLVALPERQQGITLTRDQLEAWARRSLTDDEVEQIGEALPNSSIPDAIEVIANEAIQPPARRFRVPSPAEYRQHPDDAPVRPIGEILDAREQGLDCNGAESSALKAYVRAHGEHDPQSLRVARLFPCEWDEVWSEFEEPENGVLWPGGVPLRQQG